MKPAKGFLGFLARVLGNENKNLFMVRLGSTLLLNKFGVTGPVADLLGVFVRGFLGLLVEDGTFLVDIGLDAYREGAKLKEFRAAAMLAYEKATAKVYDEDKKNEIRKEYIDLISKIGIVGKPATNP